MAEISSRVLPFARSTFGVLLPKELQKASSHAVSAQPETSQRMPSRASAPSQLAWLRNSRGVVRTKGQQKGLFRRPCNPLPLINGASQVYLQSTQPPFRLKRNVPIDLDALKRESCTNETGAIQDDNPTPKWNPKPPKNRHVLRARSSERLIVRNFIYYRRDPCTTPATLLQPNLICGPVVRKRENYKTVIAQKKQADAGPGRSWVFRLQDLLGPLKYLAAPTVWSLFHCWSITGLQAQFPVLCKGCHHPLTGAHRHFVSKLAELSLSLTRAAKASNRQTPNLRRQVRPS